MSTVPKSFPMGRLVSTAGFAAWMKEDHPERCDRVLQALARHAACDWGEVCYEDKRLNDEALRKGYRLLSAYTVDGRKFWIITEADRSVTTMLFPEEY